MRILHSYCDLGYYNQNVDSNQTKLIEIRLYYMMTDKE